MSQTDLAKKLETSVTVISRYKMNDITPSIETAKKVSSFLNNSRLPLGENEVDNLLKDHDMIKSLKEVEDFSYQEKSQIYFTLDAVIRKN